MTWAIPVKRLRETDTLIAFYHPAPSYLVHILIVPKSSRRDMKSLSANDAEFLVELFATVQSLVDEFRLPSYRLICNGGDYQEVAQLHFHLVSDAATDAL